MLRCALFLLPALALAQTTNSVTVTATRNSTLQPDQAVLGIVVETGLQSSLDDAVAALQSLGVTASSFQYVTLSQTVDYSTGAGRALLDWSFVLTAPLANMKSTITALAALQQSAPNGVSISYNVQNLQVSPQLAQSQSCSLPGLLSDARAQAARIAASAGMSVSSILALSGNTSATDSLSNPFASAASTPICSLTVKFALGSL
jgi:hypothetical protein